MDLMIKLYARLKSNGSNIAHLCYTIVSGQQCHLQAAVSEYLEPSKSSHTSSLHTCRDHTARYSIPSGRIRDSDHRICAWHTPSPMEPDPLRPSSQNTRMSYIRSACPRGELLESTEPTLLECCLEIMLCTASQEVSRVYMYCGS